MRTRYFSLLTGVLLIAANMAALAEPTPAQTRDIDSMRQRAVQAGLAERPEWQKILLYHRVMGGWQSRVDDPGYFLAKNGKHDPQAELDATIRGAFDDSTPAGRPQPNVCRFIARYQFLSRQMKALGFDYAAPHCTGFEQWRANIATHRVTLIFAAIYLNSPASMYGHTFIRFDSAKAGSFNRLNDTTVGYSVGGNSNGDPLFLVKSLLGSYPGTFIYAPFYKKVREYSDLESRDMWEYETNLSSAEIDVMLAFIWEQSFNYTNYYFFDDNCALMLLAAFEAGRPSLNLLEQAKPWLIPLDVVKLVRAQPGLVMQVRYRPAQFNNAQFNYFQADQGTRDKAVDLLDERRLNAVLATLDDDTGRAGLLDLSLAMLEYQRNRKHSAEEAESISKYQLKLSEVRSRISAQSTYRDAPRPSQSPDEGHDSFRVGLAYGQVDGSGYGRLNLRASNHDELDPESGFAIGARSKMGDLYLRFNERRVDLEKLDLFEVFAPSVRSAWFSQPTIKFSASLQRDVLRDNDLSPIVFAVDTGAGASYRLGENGRTYVLADSVIHLGKRGYLSVGPSAGMIWSLTHSLRMEIDSTAQWHASGDNRNAWLYRVGGGIACDVANSQNNVRLNVARQLQNNTNDTSRDFTDISIAYSHYF